MYYIPEVYFAAGELIQALVKARGLPVGTHAGIPDTSEVMALDTANQWIRRDRLEPGTPANGVDGDPRPSSAELGRMFLDLKVDAAVAGIRRRIGQPR